MHHDQISFGHTIHSAIRCQQRAIPDAAIELVLDFAKAHPAGGGAESYAFDKHTWQKAAEYLGSDAKYFERYRNIYVIIADGRIVTVAWRH